MAKYLIQHVQVHVLEIKCPFTYRNMTIENACKQSSFPLVMVDGSPKLKKQHPQGYYAQVQGQMALSGLDWCDFVVFLSGSHTISVERILFDPQYWNDKLLPKLKSFYFSHTLKISILSELLSKVLTVCL